jgi:hypothetical protein
VPFQRRRKLTLGRFNAFEYGLHRSRRFRLRFFGEMVERTL